MTVIERGIGNHVNIKQDADNPCQAVAYMDFNEETILSYGDVCDLLVEVRTVRRRIEWSMATHAYTRDMPTGKWHLARNDDLTKTLCNRPARGWDAHPLVGDLGEGDQDCKRCVRVYHNEKSK